MVVKINLFFILEFIFDCKSLVVTYDIEKFVFPFLVTNDDDLFLTKWLHHLWCLLICHFCICHNLEGEFMFRLELEYQFDFPANEFIAPSILVCSLDYSRKQCSYL